MNHSIFTEAILPKNLLWLRSLGAPDYTVSDGIAIGLNVITPTQKCTSSRKFYSNYRDFSCLISFLKAFYPQVP